MTEKNEMLALLNDSFCIGELKNSVPSIPCRAIICGVEVKETGDDLGEITLQFLVLSPILDAPYIIERYYHDWSVYGGIEAAFHCLLDDSIVENFYDTVGTVFDAEIVYSAYQDKICTDLELVKLIAPPIASA